jgi:hypothetical protein
MPGRSGYLQPIPTGIAAVPVGIASTLNAQYKATFYQRDDTSARVNVWLGDTPPTPSAGGGGYQVISLPKRSAVTVWQGRDGVLVQDIPVMVLADDTEYGLSTIAQIDPLIKMWRPVDDTEAPPVIRVTAPRGLIPYSTLPYWVSDFTWGAAIGDENGDRIMQQLVIQVTEYRADEELQTIKLKRPDATKRQRTYVVRPGDTLTSIAARYKLPNGWRQLGAAQNPQINDPRSLTPGTRLTIPSSS